jgi:U3 small nucleolar RNA-associated protein 13
VGCVCLSKRLNAYAEKRVIAFSASGDKIIKRWNLRSAIDADLTAGPTGKVDAIQLKATHSVRGHDKDINCVVLSPNDSILASGGQDKLVRLWKADDLTAVATLRGHKRGVWKLAFSAVDRVLCSASGDRTIRLWSMNDYTCLKSLEGHSASVLAVRFLSFQMPPKGDEMNDTNEDTAVTRSSAYNSMQILSASADGLIRLWDIRSGECVRTFDEHQDKVWAIALPTDGGHGALHNENNTQKLTSSLSELGAFFVTAGSDSRMVVWRDNSQEEEAARLSEIESRTLAEQNIENDMRAGRHGKVSKISLFYKLPYLFAPLHFMMRAHSPGCQNCFAIHMTAGFLSVAKIKRVELLY